MFVSRFTFDNICLG